MIKGKKIRCFSIILLICVVIFTIMCIFIRKGKEIAKTPAFDIKLKRSENKIIFTSPKSENIYFIFDIESEKITKSNARPDMPVDIRDCKDAWDYFFTEKRKYTLSDSFITKTELSTLKDTDIELYNAQKDKTIFAYSASNFTLEDETIFFTASFAQTKHLCRYEGESGFIKTTDITDTVGYQLYKNEIYVFGDSERYTEYDENNNSLYFSKSEVFVYDTQLNLIRSLDIVHSKGYILNFITCNDAIYILGDSLVSVYSLNGEKSSEIPLSSNLDYFCTSNDTNEHYFYDYSSNGIVKYSSDFKTKTVVCERLLTSELRFIVGAMPYCIEKDGVIYFTVSSSWAGDDSFAFCKVDKEGNVVTLMKEKKSILRNFFKSDLR